MNRRSFLTALSALPFLGWLKPEPTVAVFSNAHESSVSNVNTASGQVYQDCRGPDVLVVRPDQEEAARALIDSEYFKANIKKAKESRNWFDPDPAARGKSVNFDEMNESAYVYFDPEFEK